MWFQHGFSLKLKDLYFDTDSLFDVDHSRGALFSKDIELRIKNYEASLPNQLYHLSMDEAGLSTGRSEMYAKNVRLLPNASVADSLKLPSYLQLNLPLLSVRGLELNNILEDQIVGVEGIYLKQPDIRFYNRPGISRPLKKQVVHQAMKLRGIKLFKANGIKLQDGHIHLLKQVDSVDQEVGNSKVNLLVDQFRLDSVTLNQDFTTFPFVDNAVINFNDFHLNLKDSIHAFRAKEIELSLIDSLLWLRGIDLGARQGQNQVAALDSSGISSTYDIKIPDAKLFGINYGALLKNRDLKARTALLNQPKLDLTIFTELKEKYGSREELSVQNPQFNLYPSISKQLNSIYLPKVQVVDMALDYHRHAPSDTFDINLPKLSITATNWLVDSLAYGLPNKFFHSDDVLLHVHDYATLSKDGLTELSLKDASLSLANSSFQIDQLEYHPTVSPYQYALKLGEQKMSTQLLAQGIHGQIDMIKYLQQRKLEGSKIAVDSLQVDMFRDMEMPESFERKYPPLPQDLLRRMKMPFKLDTFELKHANLVYEHHGVKTTPYYSFNAEKHQIDTAKTGSIWMNDMYAMLTNITNDTLLSKDHQYMNLDLETQIMGQGQTEARIEFDLLAPHYDYKLEGEVEEIELPVLNSILGAAVKLNINSGNVKYLKFRIRANDSISEGTVRFRYKDLQIAVIDKHKENISVLSLIANAVIRKNNPKPGRLLKEGQVFSRRDPTKSVTNQITMALLSGIRSSIGVESKELREKIKYESMEQKKISQKRHMELNRQRREENRLKRVNNRWETQMNRRRRKDQRIENRMLRIRDRKLKKKGFETP